MKRFTLSLFATCMLSVSLMAQLPMTRSTFTGSYAPISLPAATLSTATGDDVAQSAIPIGFTFNYLGTNFTTIGVNTNGVASFDPTMSTSGTNNNLFVANAPNNSLAPWWDNLISDTILYQLQGAPGSQTFTIQWTNSLSYFNTSDQLLNFQVILYEGTNVIEFSYGTFVSGTPAPNESASIGIEGATGGAGNYLDAVTGSAFTSNGMLNAATQWPSHNFRFIPGAPTALAAGTYTVGLAGDYYSLSEAIADVNHRGINGAVTLSLLDAQYDVTPTGGDNFFPMLLGPVAGSSASNTIMVMPASGTAAIASEGTVNGNCGNAAANNVISNTNEPIFALVGVSYVTLSDLVLTCSSTGVVDRGLQVINSSATLGSQNNLAQNITVALNRANTGCYGVSQQAITTPSATTGANSNNSYLNLNISNVYTGVYLNGNANFPDANCEIGTSSAFAFNTIGGAAAGDIGGGTGNTATYGIRANNQTDVSIYNNDVRNLSHGGVTTVEGIVIDAGSGVCNVYNNKVHGIVNTTTNSTSNVTGIRVNLSTNGTNTAYVYNNFVWGISNGYTGAASATRSVRGIFVQSIAGNNTSTINVDFNNVLIDNSGALNISSTCFESGANNGPVINTRNNIFVNATGAQTGNAVHFAMAAPATNAIGNTGSISNTNDFFVLNATNGFTGIGQTTTYATLNDWQTGMTQDAASIAVDPGYFSASDLHVSAVGVNGAADMTGITWVTTDIDQDTRIVTPDMGADEFAPLLLDAGVTALVTPSAGGCYTSSENVSVSLKNFASVPLDFSADNVTVTVNISGAITQTLSFVINNNSLNGNVPLASGASMTVPMGSINMTATGTYVFDSYSSLSGDGNPINDTMISVSIDYNPGTVVASPSSVCAGSSVVLTMTGSSAGGTIQWQNSTDGGITWNNETASGFDSTTFVTIPTATTDYQVLFCGTIVTNSVNVAYLPLTAPTVADDTVCGPGAVNLTASGNGTINWYTAATGGISVSTGSTYTTNVTVTDTFYVSNTTGNTTQGVGLFDNSAGGAMSASNNSLIFDVFQNATLTGVYVYPATAGNVTVDLLDNTNALITSATVAVTTADINNRTFIPLNFNLVPGTGYQLARNAASVNCWRNNVGVNYPYTIPGVLDITTSTAGNGFYYFFYDWQVAFGCESPRVPMIVVVNTPPAITVSAASNTLCGGDSTAISASSSNANYLYTWTPAGTLSSTTGSTVTATPAATTTYTVNADDASTGCRAIDSVTVTVNTLPVFTVLSSDSVICSGTPDTLTVGIPTQSVGLFDNSAGGNMSASVNNLIFDVISNCVLAGVYVYPGAAGNVVIELQDNTNAVLNTVTFAVTAADVNNRTYVPLNFSLTPGTGMQLVRNAASVNLWRNNVGVNYPYSLPGVLDITTSTAGNGFYYFFYDWQIQTAGPYSYSWTSQPVGFTATGDSAFVAPTVTTSYIVTVTDTITGCTAQFSSVISIAPPVTATIAGPPSICLGDSAVLFAGYNGGDGTISYVWSNSLGTADSVVVTPTSNTTYSLTATDGCGSVSTDSFVVVVTTGPPAAAFSELATGVNTFTFTDASVAATSWSWDFGDTQTSTQQNPTHVYSAQGSYTVTLIVTNGCGADTLTQVVIVDGIETTEFAYGISVYPNPASGQFNIAFTAASASAVTVQLFDLQGKLMVQENIPTVNSGDVIPVNVAGFAAGTYVLKLTSDTGYAVFKVTIE